MQKGKTHLQKIKWSTVTFAAPYRTGLTSIATAPHSISLTFNKIDQNFLKIKQNALQIAKDAASKACLCASLGVLVPRFSFLGTNKKARKRYCLRAFLKVPGGGLEPPTN